ncbi:hypothetical protein M105_3492 [Bacteroides fragilis str. 1009-4-F |nr:hypothetical protein M105_3492 [Bacteroides fragilis str. 1009-4-F \
MFLHFKLNVIWSVSHCIIVDYANSCSRFLRMANSAANRLQK